RDVKRGQGRDPEDRDALRNRRAITLECVDQSQPERRLMLTRSVLLQLAPKNRLPIVPLACVPIQNHLRAKDAVLAERVSDCSSQRRMPSLCTITISGSNGERSGSAMSSASRSASRSRRLLVWRMRPEWGVEGTIPILDRATKISRAKTPPVAATLQPAALSSDSWCGEVISPVFAFSLPRRGARFFCDVPRVS